MTATTHAEYGKETEAFTVAAAFPDSIKGRTIIITGANKQGIGYAAAEAFASQGPARLILAGRTPAKLNECIDALRAKYPNIDYRALQIDLGSQKSVRAAAAEVIGWADVPTVDILVNNAGIMNIPERTFNEDDIEITMATNHVGHFLFTNLILPKLIAAAKNAPKGSVRVVNLSSSGIRASGVRFDDLRWEKPSSQLPEQQKPNWALQKAFGLEFDEEAGYNPMAAYGASKTANVLFTVGLNEKVYAKYGVLSLSLNPGEIKTELTRYSGPQFQDMVSRLEKDFGMTFKSLQGGASTTLVAATDPKLGLPDTNGLGSFLSDCQIAETPAYAVGKEESQKLWEVTEGWVGEKFTW